MKNSFKKQVAHLMALEDTGGGGREPFGQGLTQQRHWDRMMQLCLSFVRSDKARA